MAWKRERERGRLFLEISSDASLVDGFFFVLYLSFRR